MKKLIIFFGVLITLFVSSCSIVSAKGFVLTDDGPIKIPNSPRPIKIYAPAKGEVLKSGQLYYIKFNFPLTPNGRYPDSFGVWLTDSKGKIVKTIFERRITDGWIGWHVENPHTSKGYRILMGCSYEGQCKNGISKTFRIVD